MEYSVHVDASDNLCGLQSLPINVTNINYYKYCKRTSIGLKSFQLTTLGGLTCKDPNILFPLPKHDIVSMDGEAFREFGGGRRGGGLKGKRFYWTTLQRRLKSFPLYLKVAGAMKSKIKFNVQGTGNLVYVNELTLLSYNNY